MNGFTSVVIGEGTLLIHCAEALLRRGHRICGLVTADAALHTWAAQRDIPCAGPSVDLVPFLSREPFDYLFSIVNDDILPAPVLTLPRRGAINYHDALLPRYAGMHATAWALMHGETAHGVTWHEMSERVDAGDILKQRRVDIADGETAFTLNAKCYEAAIHSFAELVEELSQGRVSARKQNLEQRTYFPRHWRPWAGGVLSWNRGAKEIDALVRALDFGPYPNPLGVPKLALGKEFFLVPEIEVLDAGPAAPPGTITRIDDDSIRISTASGQVAIRRLLSLEGERLPLTEMVARYGLREGHQLEEIDPERARRITELCESIAGHEKFWLDRLATREPIVLPFAEPPAAPVNAAGYESVRMPVPEPVTAFPEGSQGVGLAGDLLLSAWAAYLGRITDSGCFDIGYTGAELRRDLAGLEGLFAPSVPLRVVIDGAKPFAEAHRAIQEQVALIERHRTYALDVEVRYPLLRGRWMPPPSGVFPIAIQRAPTLGEQWTMAGSQLTLTIPDDGAECRWVYNIEVLDGARVAGMIRQFTTFWQGLATQPACPVAQLPLLTEPERRQLLVALNDTRAEYPRERCIHELFEEQVTRAPQAIAVTFEGEPLTYHELNRRANQLAHYLRTQEVRPEILVGLCMERSLEMVVGLLGILKAGGAYLPLDPAYPRERLEFMLKDAQVPVLLIQQRLRAALPEFASPVICLDEGGEVVAGQSEENVVSGVTADNLAYVIYTSGSTGQPKGVMIGHRSVCNHLSWRRIYFPLTEADRLLQKASISFDDSVWELFEPLIFGARLVMARPDGHQDSAYLVRLIREQQITAVSFVPSMLQVFLEEPGVERCRSLRRVTTGGESLSVALQERFFERLNATLHNGYGPTEATIAATFWTCQRGSSARSIPIGRPIANTQIYLLDSHLQLVPMGVPGDLYIGGEGLARGYLNRSELTAERFIPHPFSAAPGARLYRTGDRAQYLPDGSLEFLGRVDHQVKVRGFRIELGEIEAALSLHPGVRESAVLAREAGELCPDRAAGRGSGRASEFDEKRLTAYVVLDPVQPPATMELRQYLKEKLPDYMLPTAFVSLEALPLTPSGKLDRQALPAPDSIRSLPEAAYVAPRGPVEQRLAKMWEKALRAEPIGVKDNFFDLGGHSLLAVRLLAQIETVFGRELPLRTFIHAPTVEGLARILRPHAEASTGTSLVAIQPSGSRPSFFCISVLGGGVDYYRLLARYLGPDQPVYALHPIDPFGLEGRQEGRFDIPTRIADTAALYLAEIRAVQADGPYCLGAHSLGGLVALELAQQLRAQGQEVALLALFEPYTPAAHPAWLSTPKLRHHLDRLHRLRPKEKVVHLRRRIDSLIGRVSRLPYQTCPGFGRLLPRVLRKVWWLHVEEERDDQSGEQYLMQEYPGRVTLFRSQESPFDWNPGVLLPVWQRVAAGGLEIHTVPGDHMTMVAEPNIRFLAEQLTVCLSKALGESGPLPAGTVGVRAGERETRRTWL